MSKKWKRLALELKSRGFESAHFRPQRFKNKQLNTLMQQQAIESIFDSHLSISLYGREPVAPTGIYAGSVQSSLELTFMAQCP